MLHLSYDFHIHSSLSPCSNNDMTPGNIVAMAKLKKLDAIAVTDHNSCKNIPAVMSYAKQFGILAIPGMELTTQEEVHVLCYFYSLSAAMRFDALVYQRLIPIANREEVFGEQIVYDNQDNPVEKIPNLLINSTTISFDELWGLLAEYDGIMVPAHLDKTSASIISNLGFIPPDSKFDCAELRHLSNLKQLQETNPYLKSCRIISSSDAHSLHEIREPSYTIQVKEKSIRGVLDALSKK
ncbi:PHP domain-containing protein [Clostridium aminobutyricum]|uniref:PHP domain-containing protein n=1 Tax=Clostridium aminobutyricum TaxID=33953 RepID=A0A939D6E2_CLOAM|nr:PHP domain-containing protein [Clostridium aminobutyricum]MBN7772067.1 PHP domain-containing protein [Clostridium aminobutyricum]